MSSDTFQLVCTNCSSKLNAKIALIGQTRNCPKCKFPLLIQREDNNAYPVGEEVPPRQHAHFEPPQKPQLGDRGIGRNKQIENLPEYLHRNNRYVILNADRIIAVWENGKGWQISNVGSGFIPAKKNFSAIPDNGAFAFAEIVIGSENSELAAAGAPRELHIFRITQRGALTSLARDESEILEKIDAPSELTGNQKTALMTYLRQNFTFEILAHSTELLNSLSIL
ncbi:hypothetical protein FACS189427_06620 [Planctomycetales bacterium]|nr:hypothetical protein FACS189427_06620 [Planctomycetales bacterium]